MSDTADARATIEQCIDLAERLQYLMPSQSDRLHAELVALRAVVAAAEAYAYDQAMVIGGQQDAGMLGIRDRSARALLDAAMGIDAARQHAAPAPAREEGP